MEEPTLTKIFIELIETFVSIASSDLFSFRSNLSAILLVYVNRIKASKQTNKNKTYTTLLHRRKTHTGRMVDYFY